MKMMFEMGHLPEGSAGRLAVASLVAGCLLCSSMCSDRQGHDMYHVEEAISEKFRMQKHDIIGKIVWRKKKKKQYQHSNNSKDLASLGKDIKKCELQ